MKRVRFAIVLSVAAALLPMASVAPASAALSALNKRTSEFIVTPAMMHAIDIIVAEKMKMMHRRHR